MTAVPADPSIGMRDSLREIAEWTVAWTGSQAGHEVRHAARRVLLDQVGVSFGGTARHGNHGTLAAARGDSGPPLATIWATRGPAHAPLATLTNRAAGDELELLAGPECAAAAIAAAEVADATLGDVLDALIVAAEVDEYFRAWLLLPIERHGLHPPAFIGAVTAAVTAGRLLGLDVRTLSGVLAAASVLAPVSPYAAFSEGATGKTLYGAWSQRLGVQAALWSLWGMEGPATAWEGSSGIAAALFDREGPVTAPRFDPSGRAIARVTFKPFPCSRACHATLTALERLGPLDHARIAGIDVLTYPFAVTVDRRARGPSPIAAQASIRTTLALAIVWGGLEPGRAYARDRLLDPRVADLARRIDVAIDPSLEGDGPRVRRARLKVRLDDGTVLEHACAPRWGADDPAPDADLVRRFAALSGGTPAFDPWPAPESTRIRSLVAGADRG